MNSSPWNLLLVGVPAIVASAAVLAVASVSASAWLVQAIAVCLALFIALAGKHLGRRGRTRFPARTVIVACLVGLGTPMLGALPGPDRWLSLGPVSLYMAPAVLPLFLAACSILVALGGRSERFACLAIAGASLLLALQPDASQAAALVAGAAVLLGRSRSRVSLATILAAATSTIWAFVQPDPLQPVAHVEGVFALAFGYSLFAGLLVAASAVVLVAGLLLSSSESRIWLSAVAAYYAVLFACSIAELTPAPIVGYGAGPLLGYGLLAAASNWLATQVPPNNSSKPTPLRGAA